MSFDVWSDVRTSDEIPSRPDYAGWDLVRTPASGALSLVCLSRDFSGVFTHWWGGRTIPCRKSGCPAHDAGHSARWHGYLLCEVSPGAKRVLFEFTDQAAATFAELRKEHGTLRGLCFRASRSRARANGRVIITAVKHLGSGARLTPEVPVRSVLSVIWGLTPDAQDDQDGTGDVVPITPQPKKPRGGSGGRAARA